MPFFVCKMPLESFQFFRKRIDNPLPLCYNEAENLRARVFCVKNAVTQIEKAKLTPT